MYKYERRCLPLTCRSIHTLPLAARQYTYSLYLCDVHILYMCTIIYIINGTRYYFPIKNMCKNNRYFIIILFSFEWGRGNIWKVFMF